MARRRREAARLAEPVTSAPASERAGAGCPGREPSEFSQLLDRGAAGSWLGLVLIAAGLGAIHAVQPGHGKTLVSAIALGQGSRWYEPALLGLFTTLAHTGSVLVLALILWYTGATRVAGLHRGLTQAAGFAIAAGGFWRLGRYLGNWGEHPMEMAQSPADSLSVGSWVWESRADWCPAGTRSASCCSPRPSAGSERASCSSIAFGLGMAAVLVAVGLGGGRLKSAVLLSGHARAWESRLGLASGAMLAGIGLIFFLS